MNYSQRRPYIRKYKDMPGSSSHQPLSNNDCFGYNSQSSYQPNSNNDVLTRRDVKAPQTSNYTDSDSSESSFEHGHEGRSMDDDILAQAMEFTKRVRRPANVPSALSKPVVVPQTVAGAGQAFVRCWSPAPDPYNITESDFLEFIDNLNIVATASPPLQILDLVGGVLGMVPSHIVQLVAFGVQTFAKLGTVVVSKSRTEIYMKAVNRDFFAPRGLKATIASRDAMAILLRLPDSVGRLTPITAEIMDCSMLERRLEGKKPYMSELRSTLPLLHSRQQSWLR